MADALEYFPASHFGKSFNDMMDWCEKGLAGYRVTRTQDDGIRTHFSLTPAGRAALLSEGNSERIIPWTDTTLEQRLRDQHHMTQGDGLGAMLVTANEAASTIASLRDANKALTAERDAARAMSDAHREHAQSAVENCASLNRLLSIAEADRDRLSAELAEARKRSDGHLCGHAETGTYSGQVVLVAPDWLKHKWPNGIGIDVCLALEIQQLWQRGIKTSGHCCGHGRLPAYISVWPEEIAAMQSLGYETFPHPDGRGDHFVPKTFLASKEASQ